VQPAVCHRVGPIPEAGVQPDLVDQAGVPGLQPQRLGHAVAAAEDVDAAVVSLPDRLVPLLRMIRPRGRDRARPAGRAATAERCEEQELQVVGLQLRPLHPPVRRAPVHHLHQLQPVVGRTVQRGRAVVVAHPGPRQHAPRLVQGAEQRGQMPRVVEVVARQVSDQRRPGGGEPRVQGGAEAAVSRRAEEPDPRVGPERRERARHVVGRAVVDDHELPIGHGRRDQAADRPRQERGLVVGGHQHAHAGNMHAINVVPPLFDPVVRRVALVRPRVGLGDWICSLPALRVLRQARPDLHVTAVTFAEMRPLLERIRELVDDLLPFPGDPGIPDRPADAAAWPAFLAAARAGGFDLALQAYGDRPAANILTAALGATRVGGFAPTGWAPERDAALHLPYPIALHEVRRHLRLVEHLGIPLPPDAERMEFPVLAEERERFVDLSERAGLEPGGYAVLHAGASAPTRRWPVERFARLGDALAARDLRVVLGGVAAECPLTARLRRLMTAPALDLAGATTVGAYALLLAGAAVLVSGDTGAAHLAAATGTRSVTIFMAGDAVRWAHPGPRHRAARAAVGCNPCPHLACPLHGSRHLRCGTALTVADVLAEVDAALATS
jgi:ADP-heptose:LPS heptosyltransferase